MGALNKRHDLIVSEMGIRGFNHNSPIKVDDENIIWPTKYIDKPIKHLLL